MFSPIIFCILILIAIWSTYKFIYNGNEVFLISLLLSAFIAIGFSIFGTFRGEHIIIKRPIDIHMSTNHVAFFFDDKDVCLNPIFSDKKKNFNTNIVFVARGGYNLYGFSTAEMNGFNDGNLFDINDVPELNTNKVER